MTFPLDAINATLDRLSRHPFYAGRLPRQVTCADEFAARVPPMRRNDLVGEMRKPGFGAFACPQAVRMNFSPMGGGLVPILHTKADLARINAAAGSQLSACGIGPDDVCAVTFGYHLFVAGLFYQSQMEAHGVTCVPAGPGEADRTAALCRDAGVTVLAGNPSFALRLLEAGMPAPRVFFAGGEPFTGNRTLYDAVRQAMPETQLIDSFSLSEVLPVARTFPGGEGVHVFDELLYAEVMDPETEAPVAEGERGELVLTHLGKEAQPLVRYRTGDLTLLQHTAPLHGRRVNLPRVVFGRTDDMVKVKGVKLYPSELRTVLLGLPGTSGSHRLLIDSLNGGDRLTLIVEGLLDEVARETVRRSFKSQTLLSLDSLETVESLPEGPVMLDERT
ncbi:phenylacetate--CoA ligase family protein [Algihabitans albus]|uniref:phenylacetate--CoA ligase family protein n=1 Tax=Algihabitans albus TaxID=2164067 RepID=UPI000E5D07BA|nr:AMP-binding protein [Algihabitans albus]